ncbi:MAG: pitrilysin family protein [Myxococcota bacterium]|nr:pitrilysin family protein [Myxococcota bacterium]
MKTIALSLMMMACAPKSDEAIEGLDFRASAPAPLERNEFRLPTAEEVQLSNGLRVVYVQDETVPMSRVTVAFRLGSFAEEESNKGLVGATFDMLNEGIDGHDSLSISASMKRLGSSLSTAGGLDGGYVSVSGLTRNLDESLEFLKGALTAPTFQPADWERLQKNYQQDLQKTRSTPGDIARRVFRRAFYDGTYAGRLSSEESIAALNVNAMVTWWEAHAVVENAMVVATGDLPLDQLVPKLESALGELPRGEAMEVPKPEVHELEQTEILFVHKAGSAQSVIRMGRDLGADYGDEDYWPIRVGNGAFGGIFMARLNMNLREDKGYTYGARSGTYRNYGSDRWELSTSVRTDATAASLFEIFRELADIGGDAPARPLSEDEIRYAQGSSINGYPARFETPNTLLQQLSDIWRYDLPSDAVEAYIANVDSVEPAAAQSAFAEKIADKPMLVVVVGDWDVVGESVTALGYTVRQMDVDGNPLEAAEE